MANVRDVNDFVEQLSNCIGEISGDEVVFKKIPYTSEYVVRMRNHNEKVANIWYDYDKDKIIVQLVPAFRSMEYSLDDLTIDTIKGIGQMVRKNALNRIGESMEFKEAKQILNENGFILVENMNQIVGMIDDLKKQNAIILYDMVDPKIAELYVTRSQYDAITVFEEFQEIAKLKKKWGLIKGLGDEDLSILDVNDKKLIKGYIDKNLPVWKIRIYF